MGLQGRLISKQWYACPPLPSPSAQCLVQPSLVYTLLCPPPEPVTGTTTGACQAASHTLYSELEICFYSFPQCPRHDF